MRRLLIALLCLATLAAAAPAAQAERRLPIRGADVSSLAKSEALGGVYRHADGRRDDALRILAQAGLTHIRLKVWVDPADGYNTKTQVLAVAKRAKKAGLRLLVDFHYSDTWADPGKQFKPAAWANLPFDELVRAVYAHTFDVLDALRRQGTPADLVQVGNEINGGLLWPDGSNQNWANTARLLNAGHDAVKDVSRRTDVVLHLANGGDNGLYRWWFDNAAAHGIRYDVIGLSYYPYWHGTLEAFQANIDDVATRYRKPVAVVETGYPFTTADDDGWENLILSPEPYPGYQATPAGQAALLSKVSDIVRNVPDRLGLGVFAWEATWTGVPGNGWDPADPATGNAWENQALFGFDDRALPAMRALGRG
ncbi:glycoside hydrolase family 53 protein [Nonomuraea harbinensis]|uniref:Arabinogalactan endo-beta-1,4-galactanase n=1 Tax=Nonomuraea harbinensis TaxID=1286938 RepID=A0ABW1BRD5_9ACTN|nr:arabinogalactan endo-1,4-beta-galactosidase [Nonomuraea harbinensis]